VIQTSSRVLLVWFGFFGSFLVGASWRFLSRYSDERLLSWCVLLYGVLFMAYYPVQSSRRLLKWYFLLMALGAVAMTSRLGYVAWKRPSLYRHREDWLLLGFMLAGMWSAVPASWRMLTRKARATAYSPAGGGRGLDPPEPATHRPGSVGDSRRPSG
jgi:hypothetical protein